VAELEAETRRFLCTGIGMQILYNPNSAHKTEERIRRHENMPHEKAQWGC